MNTNSPVALAVTAAAVVGVSVVQTIRTTKVERAKRRQIQINKDLDMKAIRIANDVLLERLNDPNYISRGLMNALEDFDNEMAFQKMIIRM